MATKPMPKPYLATVTTPRRPGILSRVGSYATVADALAGIEKEKAAGLETFGGLLPPGNIKGREYRIFRAEWTEVNGNGGGA